MVRKTVRAELCDQLSYPARIESKINTSILADADGIVSHLYTPLGTEVSARKPLMQLSHTDPVYQYAPFVVRAPIHGVVSQVDVTEGSQVTRGQRLATLTDPKSVRGTVELPALDLPSLALGQAGELKISGRAETIPVRISGISPFVDPATGTASCTVEFLTPNLQLRPGLLGQVTFRTNVRKGFSIPEFAVIYRGADPFVRVVEAGKARNVAIHLGHRQLGSVEILDGLQDGMLLVERASRFVGDGDLVQAEDAK